MQKITPPVFTFQDFRPDRLIDSLSRYGIWLDSGLTELNSYENRVYQFTDENRTRYVVKFYRPARWDEAQIREEHELTLTLAQAGLPVAAPLALEGDTLLSQDGYLFALFPSIGGRAYETDNPDQLESAGRLLGRLHQISRERCFEHRPVIGLQEYLLTPRDILAQCPLIPKARRNDFIQTLDTLIRETSARWHDDWHSIRLHGDCHPGNILWRDEPWLVDFDDARNGPAVQDLWMLLSGDTDSRRYQLDILLEAYQEFCDFDTRELALIEPLRAMRMVHFLSWVARRWQDPAFPKAFPWMAESDFWSQQQSLMTEQIAVLAEPPLTRYLPY